jgi:hypothetical protein
VQDNVTFDTRVFDGYVEGDGNVVHGDITPATTRPASSLSGTTTR